MNAGRAESDSPTSTYVPSGAAPLYRELAARIRAETRYSTTPSQVHEWVMAGLLPRTRMESLGWRRGFSSAVDERLFDQVVALCRFRQLTNRTDRLRMLLWMEDWDVDPALVQRDVLTCLNGLPKRKPREDGGMDALYAGIQRRAPGFLRRLGLRRTKRSTAVDGVFAAASLGLGAAADVERRSVALLVRAFGLDRALRDRVGDSGPWLTGDLAADLRSFARMRPLTRIYARVASLTLDELQGIRAYARFVALDLPLFARVLELRFGPNAFGFGGMRIVTGRPEHGIAVAAFFARTRLRHELKMLAALFAENRKLMLAAVDQAVGDDWPVAEVTTLSRAPSPKTFRSDAAPKGGLFGPSEPSNLNCVC
jgi:hypothetical protein